MRAVLTYHSIDPSDSPVSVSPDEFERQMTWLVEDGPPVVSVGELLAMGPEADAIALSFDDAFENFRTVALPVLRDLDLPITLGVVTEHVGTTNRWGGRDQAGIPTLPLMDWDGLAEALDSKVVEIANHTRTHPHLPTLDRDALHDEVEGARDELRARLGVETETFVYPYGELSETVVQVVSGGYSRALTTRLDAVPSRLDPLRVPRVDMFYFRRPGQLQTWGTPRFRMRLGARRLLRSLRARLG